MPKTPPRHHQNYNPLETKPFLHKTCRFVLTNGLLLTIITVNDIVSLDTPPKNDAAPIRAKAPGSIHAQ